MKSIKKILLILFFTYTALINAQTKSELFPDDLTIQPFTANFLEPKLGFLFQLSENELRLDIGNSIDFVRFNLEDNQTLAFGADLFTYTMLRGEENFHFPVDAVDYLFGINASYKKKILDDEFGFRFRLSHISAHFVDGHYDSMNNRWRDGINPRVYSREFLELIPFYKFAEGIRFYSGLTYIFHVDPTTIKKDNYQIGFDYFIYNLIGDNITPFIAYDFKLIHLENYIGNNSILGGIKFGNPNGKGFSLYLSYYSGNNYHGEYFDYRSNYSALGLNIDL